MADFTESDIEHIEQLEYQEILIVVTSMTGKELAVVEMLDASVRDLHESISRLDCFG